jgi:hypothetical protein
LVAAALAYSRFVSGAWHGIDVWLEKVDRWARRHEETPEQRNARHWCCSTVVARKLQHLEQEVNTLVEFRVGRRLEELERQERWRVQTEYSELREIWKTLLGDPSTSEEVRQACREWLAKYPETLDFLARRLMQMGLLREKELPENWEEREIRKHRIQ